MWFWCLLYNYNYKLVVIEIYTSKSNSLATVDEVKTGLWHSSEDIFIPELSF